MFFVECFNEAKDSYNYHTQTKDFDHNDVQTIKVLAEVVGSAEESDKILWDLVFPPNSYQIFKIDNSDNVEGSLSFPGVFNMDHEESWELGDLEYSEKRMKYVERVNVYFSDREPTVDWGYPSQFHNLWEPENTGIQAFGTEFWVMVANPTTDSYRIQMKLDNATTLAISALTLGMLTLFAN